MGFGLHTIGHLVGDVASPVLNGVGAVTGADKLTNIGHAIGSPGVVYTGTINPVGATQTSNGASFSAASGGSGSSSSKPVNATGQTVDSTYNGSTIGGSGSGAGSLSSAYNTYQSQANNDLNTLLNSFNNSLASLNSNYNIQGNQLDSSKAATTNTYNNNVTQQNQDLLRQQNQVQQGTHNAYQNLMNLLGAYGGGGTSVAQNWAPTAAQNFQNTQLGDANQTAAANLKSLDTAYGNFMNDYDNQKKQLADSHNQDVANAQGQYNTTRDALNTILGNISSQAVPASDIGSSLSGLSIPNIQFAQPSYTGSTPVYNAPNLSTFEASTPTANFTSPASVSNSSTTPALAFLMNQQKQNQPQF